MTEPITPKPGTARPGTGARGTSGTDESARESGHRDTVLLSDVPDAAAVVAEALGSSAASASPSLTPAALAALGVRYEILGEAGHGSMGNVYKARDRETGETVALKLLKPEIASDQAMMDRFKNELLFARKITHKNVCRVYEFNRVAGIAYTSMEFVEGESLRSVLNRFGGLPQRKATDLTLQICSGLKEAHAQGIVHRDLKPENVMIDAQGNVKIMDFGIARSMEAGTRLTGSMVGTPAYMAPEQVAGKPVDYRTDIYSLGLMLYEMFTGSPAFSADNSIAVALKQMREDPPPPHEIEPGIPVATERAILKCLEKDPAKRFQSIADLEANLRSGVPVMPAPRQAGTATNANRVSTGLPRRPAISQPVPRRTSPFVWILLGALLVVAALVGLHWMGVVQAANRIVPPAPYFPLPKPPEFAYEHPAPPPVAPIVEEAKAPEPKAANAKPAPVLHAKAASPEPAKPAATPDVFPRMETGPVRKKEYPAIPDSLRHSASGSNTVITNSTYLWVGRYDREGKAQSEAKKIEDMKLPASIVPRAFGSLKFYVVFCGPIDPKKVSAVTDRLEAKGFLNVHTVANPFGSSKER
jgi:Protein kinase domain